MGETVPNHLVNCALGDCWSVKPSVRREPFRRGWPGIENLVGGFRIHCASPPDLPASQNRDTRGEIAIPHTLKVSIPGGKWVDLFA